jgi:XapX domain-containing protein
MKDYAVSLAVGLAVGAAYGLVHVRSPAPPVVALVGLLGILAGEQIPGFGHALWLRTMSSPTAQNIHARSGIDTPSRKGG